MIIQNRNLQLIKVYKLDEDLEIDTASINIGEYKQEKDGVCFVDFFLIKKTEDTRYEVMALTGPFKGNKYKNVYGGKDIWRDPINFKGYTLYRKYDEKSCPEHILDVVKDVNSKDISTIEALRLCRNANNLHLNLANGNESDKYLECERKLKCEAAKERTDFLFFRDK